MVIQEQNFHGAGQECRKMQGPFTQAYEPLGDLLIEFDDADNATEYRRSLDLDSAIGAISYSANGRWFSRETFASALDQVIVTKLTQSDRENSTHRTA